MLAVGVLLTTLTALAPAASTYEEAACAEPAPPPVNCSEPPAVPAVPTVIDCNDERVSHWVGEMIGSCDMPRPTAPATALARGREPSDGPRQEICDGGIRCRPNAQPLRAGVRSLDTGPSSLTATSTLAHFLMASRLIVTSPLGRSQAERDRVERPPRV
jgi:hypothetical protein